MTQRDQPQTNDAREWMSQAGSGLLAKIGLFFVAILILVFVLSWLIFSGRLSLDSEPPVSAANAIGPFAQPGLIAIEVDGVELGIAQQLDPPTQVEVGGFQFEVANQYLNGDDLWKSSELPANQVSWLENSIVNYTFRLPATRGYRDMLVNASAANSLINLTTSQGSRLSFTVEQAIEQPASDNYLLSQNRPAITLVWVGEAASEAAYIVTGTYAPATEVLQAADFGIQSFDPEPTSGTASGELQVTIQGITIQNNGLELLVRGVMTNQEAEVRMVEAADINLMSGGLVSQILSATPPFPWQVSPNNSQMFFTLTLQRPLESDAILTIGQQPFALSFE